MLKYKYIQMNLFGSIYESDTKEIRIPVMNMFIWTRRREKVISRKGIKKEQFNSKS